MTLTGPVTVHADRVAHEGQAWAEACASIEAASAGCAELAAWIGRIRSSGVVKRLAAGSPAKGRQLLEALASVVAALPTSGGESLSAFAARITGRAHALDDGSPLGTLALAARPRARRARAARQTPESAAEERREAWAAVGVLCDELSSIVLTLALAGDASATGGVLAAAVASGEPVWLTLRQLARTPPRWHGIESVLTVENPWVVALGADALGARCPPIVCTNGQPRAATMLLLRSLAAADVRLRHHGDFDGAGLTIDKRLHRRLPTEPWQFDRRAYRRAVAAHPQGRADDRVTYAGQLVLRTRGCHARGWQADRRGTVSQRHAGDAPLDRQARFDPGPTARQPAARLGMMVEYPCRPAGPSSAYDDAA